MVKTLTVLGARPQFIKASPVLELLDNDILVHTGQHYDKCMNDIFFDNLKIKEPDHHLSIGSGTGFYQVTRIMKGVEDIIALEDPKAVIVYGDTNSTLGAALAAKNLGVKLIHIESGLRSYNMEMPEEYNRVLTDRLSDIKLCPTKNAVQNLKKEGLNSKSYFVGDTMLDVLINNKSKYDSKKLNEFGVSKKDYYLCTLHRPVNADDSDKLSIVFSAFAKSNQTVIFPIHPRTKKNIDLFSIDVPENVKLIDPVNYIEMMILTASASVVITDSGGLQKEAHILETPCITLRNETEWIESLRCGWNILSGIDEDEILQNLNHSFPTKQDEHPYGDGEASHKIVDIINA
jgi:UDP-GlcNAc3NAcA epimerase